MVSVSLSKSDCARVSCLCWVQFFDGPNLLLEVGNFFVMDKKVIDGICGVEMFTKL